MEEKRSTGFPISENDTYLKYYIRDIGDLRYSNAYEIYDGSGCTVAGNIIFDEPANFELSNDEKIILSFSNGIRNTNTL